jgi:putative MFS transporter
MPSLRSYRRDLSPEHWLVLGVLGLGGFFEGYDSFVFTVAMPQIRDTFALSQGSASLWLSILFIGSLPSMLLARYSDVYGRRRLLLTSIVGYCAFTALTAVTPSITLFVASQFMARLFLHAECAIAWTIITEQLPAGARGFGFGWLATMSAGGTVVSSFLYGVAFGPNSVSWRWLYVVAVAPLIVMAALSTRFPETMQLDVRSRNRDRGPSEGGHWHEILRKPHRRAFFLIGCTDLLFALAIIVDVFSVDYMQTDRGLSITQSSLILMVAAVVAIPAAWVAGSLSDRYGRRLVGTMFGLVGIAGSISFFLAARTPFGLAVFLSMAMVGQFGAWPTFDAYATELFPARIRAFAVSTAALWRVPGEFLGLAVGSALIANIGVGPAAGLLAAGPLVGMLIIWLTFPETNGVELDEIENAGLTFGWRRDERRAVA